MRTGNLSEPTKALGAAMLAGRVRHQGNPVLDYRCRHGADHGAETDDQRQHRGGLHQRLPGDSNAM
jgi:hypothetical protein